MRTLFDGLHHFAPADARAVLADAAAAREPILVAEASERSAAALVLTYLVPLLPLCIFWDGLVSCLRTYRVDELRALVADLNDGYRWETGTVRKAGRNVTFLLGTPQLPAGYLLPCQQTDGRSK